MNDSENLMANNTELAKVFSSVYLIDSNVQSYDQLNQDSRGHYTAVGLFALNFGSPIKE